MLYCKKKILEGGGAVNWYQGAVPKEWIVQIHICEKLPALDWDEQWWADSCLAHCARRGSELFLSGEKIQVQTAMFEGFLSVKEIHGLEQLDASFCQDLSRLFAGCSSLKRADLSAWNTSSMLKAEGLFDGCVSLEYAELGDWNLSHCCSISAMFRECNRLQNLDVRRWNVSQVRDFSDAFSCCYALESLNVSAWNTSSAQTMEGLFNRCSSLSHLDVSHWNTEQLQNGRYLFHRCEKLKKLDLKHWNFRKDMDCRNMFLQMYGSITLPRQRRFRTLQPRDSWLREHLRGGRLQSVATIALQKKMEENSWYDACWAVDEAGSGFLFCVKQGEKLIICSRGGSVYTNEDSSLCFCFPDENGVSWLQKIEGLELLNTRYTRDFSFMFSGNIGLQRLDAAHFNFSSANNVSGMFLNCHSLQELNTVSWQIPSDAEQQGMFQGCASLQKAEK